LAKAGSQFFQSLRLAPAGELTPHPKLKRHCWVSPAPSTRRQSPHGLSGPDK